MDFLHRTWAEIDMRALIHNFKLIKESCGDSEIMCVVKADAYGHSAKAVATALSRAGAHRFAVSNIEEAMQLREYGIKEPILILGYTPATLAKVLCENSIEQSIFSPEYAKKLSAEALKTNSRVKVHLKFDSGMGRIGFDIRNVRMEGIDEAISALRLPGLIFEGAFTHFAVCDSEKPSDKRFTHQQYNRFIEALDILKQNGFVPKYRHCCNSAGVCVQKEMHMDICRPGIILYGLLPSEELDKHKNLMPVMTVKSVVSMVKTIHKGDTVSYGRTFTAKRDMRVATVTAGYADGYPRRLSGKGYVIINGMAAPIIGRICMDQMVIDITGIHDVCEGDEVILFGKQLPVEKLADICGTISYEIICGISPRVPRVIINSEGE